MKHSETEGVQYGLYRSRSGAFLGVAKGLAQGFKFPVWLVRVAFIFIALLTHVVPTIIVYLILAAIMRKEPILDFSSSEEREFYNTYGDNRRPALHRMRDILSRLDKRVRRLEDAVTDPENDWERRFRNS
jgi:phage shock protein C